MDDALAPRLEQRLEQRPALLAYLALLATPSGELEGVVDQAILKNPMLVRAPGGPCVGCGRHCASGTLCAACSMLRIGDRDLARATDWRTQLELEARLELPVTRHALLAEVVGTLEDDGLLPRDGDDSDQLREVLAALRVVGPPGIAARSPADCVAVQLQALVDMGRLPAWVRSITLADLAAGIAGDGPPDLVAIAATVVGLVTPFVALPGPAAPPPPPDVRYTLAGDTLTVEVLDAGWFGIALDDDAWRGAGREGRAWLRPHRQEARGLIDALGARAGMLRRLAEWLGETQRDFLLNGPQGHQPLTRAAAAEALGHHPATIGRAVAGKTARCPDGRLIPLSACFGGRTAVLDTLAHLAEELPGASDEVLARRLTEAGHPVARRTVSKYRRLLGVAAQR